MYILTEGLTVDDVVIIANYEGLSATTPISVTNFAPISIEIAQKPTKTTYLLNETLDLTGLIAKITFNDGTSSQLLNGEGVTVSPSEDLQTDDTTITVSYTFNGITVTTTFEIIVVNASSTLSDNSWETIRIVSESGLASQIWNIGDTKNATVNGNTYTFRIIGFDHDDLATTLSNGRTKAGITFEMDDVYETTYRLNSSYNLTKWANTTMYTSSLPSLLELFENDLKNCIKEVKKMTGYSTELTTDIHKLFILSAYELVEGLENIDGYIPTYVDGTVYEYYKSGNSYLKTAQWWLRTFVRVYSTNRCEFAYVYGNSTILQSSPGSVAKAIAPAFCI